MIPHLLTCRLRRPDGRWRRLFVPVLPVLLVLSPLLLVALLVAWPVLRINPLGALRGAWQVFRALPGLQLDIEHGRTVVRVSVS